MGRFLEKVGWGGQLGGIQNQPGGFEEKCLVTLLLSATGLAKRQKGTTALEKVEVHKFLF